MNWSYFTIRQLLLFSLAQCVEANFVVILLRFPSLRDEKGKSTTTMKVCALGDDVFSKDIC